MSDFEPRPLLVMRNQLLAFALLNLLGSCAPLPATVTQSAVKSVSNLHHLVLSQPETGILSCCYSGKFPAR